MKSLMLVSENYKFVPCLAAALVMVCVRNVTVVTSLQANLLKSGKRLVSSLHNPSVNREHSSPCVRSIPGALRVTISLKVCLVFRSSLKPGILKGKLQSVKLTVLSKKFAKPKTVVKSKSKAKLKLKYIPLPMVPACA
ncbi:hypothetical protein D3C80_1363770 [compost metagenome]